MAILIVYNQHGMTTILMGTWSKLIDEIVPVKLSLSASAPSGGIQLDGSTIVTSPVNDSTLNF